MQLEIAIEEMFERALDSARDASHGMATALSHMQL
jgi:hypothetical protein